MSQILDYKTTIGRFFPMKRVLNKYRKTKKGGKHDKKAKSSEKQPKFKHGQGGPNLRFSSNFVHN
jgi:hypothetical protein